MRGATAVILAVNSTSIISIHAPRAGCDVRGFKSEVHTIISIHAPRAGCDGSRLTILSSVRDFNPRTPCGVRRCHCILSTGGTNFNPRTPCGVRRLWFVSSGEVDIFQSTHPVRGATALMPELAIRPRDFNPRTPCGVRRPVLRKPLKALRFQSTHPVRGATASMPSLSSRTVFQSTHPVRGATHAISTA